MQFSAVLFSIGAIIDEAQGNQYSANYLSNNRCSKARQLLVLKWTLIGFLLAISYKSVLRALLMKGEYENIIDTLDDVLESGRTLEVPEDTPLRFMLETDPRDKVKRLAEKAKFHIMGIKPPESLLKG